jgi:hypothetical protein
LNDRVGQRAAEFGHLTGLFPLENGRSRTASGLFHLKASIETSPTIPANAFSPASGTVSTLPAQTAEYARIESSSYVPSFQGRVNSRGFAGVTLWPNRVALGLQNS